MTSAIFAGKILQAWKESPGDTGAARTAPRPRARGPECTHGALPHGRVLQAAQDLHGRGEVPLLVARLRDQQELGQQRHLQLGTEGDTLSLLQPRRAGRWAPGRRAAHWADGADGLAQTAPPGRRALQRAGQRPTRTGPSRSPRCLCCLAGGRQLTDVTGRPCGPLLPKAASFLTAAPDLRAKFTAHQQHLDFTRFQSRPAGSELLSELPPPCRPSPWPGPSFSRGPCLRHTDGPCRSPAPCPPSCPAGPNEA